jgi:peptide/nickel transport system ATP-binding protein
VQDRCRTEVPAWQEIDTDHFVACHFANELTLQGAKNA